MLNTQIKSIQESIFSLREIALEVRTTNPAMIGLAEYIEARCNDIEVELYVQPSESELESL